MTDRLSGYSTLGYAIGTGQAVELRPPRPNDRDGGWWLNIQASDAEVTIDLPGVSDRDLEAWLLRAARRVRDYRDGDRGGPTAETLRHAGGCDCTFIEMVGPGMRIDRQIAQIDPACPLHARR